MTEYSTSIFADVHAGPPMLVVNRTDLGTWKLPTNLISDLDRQQTAYVRAVEAVLLHLQQTKQHIPYGLPGHVEIPVTDPNFTIPTAALEGDKPLPDVMEMWKSLCAKSSGNVWKYALDLGIIADIPPVDVQDEIDFKEHLLYCIMNATFKGKLDWEAVVDASGWHHDPDADLVDDDEVDVLDISVHDIAGLAEGIRVMGGEPLQRDFIAAMAKEDILRLAEWCEVEPHSTSVAATIADIVASLNADKPDAISDRDQDEPDEDDFKSDIAGLTFVDPMHGRLTEEEAEPDDAAITFAPDIEEPVAAVKPGKKVTHTKGAKKTAAKAATGRKRNR